MDRPLPDALADILDALRQIAFGLDRMAAENEFDPEFCNDVADDLRAIAWLLAPQ